MTKLHGNEPDKSHQLDLVLTVWMQPNGYNSAGGGKPVSILLCMQYGYLVLPSQQGQ